MARRLIAQVINNQLTHFDPSGNQLPCIQVGTNDWYAWLNTQNIRSFAYRTSQGTLTARFELRRSGKYWYAYRSQGAKLRKVYLGKSAELTPQRLDDAMLKLSEASSSKTEAVEVNDLALLKTTLAIPPLPPHVVTRPRLMRQLQEGTSRLLTLVCTPAGFGKTTLLSSWVRDHHLPAAWISLHHEDNNPARFIAYLIQALQTQLPHIGTKILDRLSSTTLLSSIATLINDLASSQAKTTIIFDNYHVIHNQTIHEMLKFLLERLPEHVHVVLATRFTPPFSLTRLYISGQVTELRADSLRFTQEEIQMFLTSVTGAPPEPDDVLSLEQKTEGWAAGLKLAKSATHGQKQTTDHNRYIRAYFMEEVFQAQPPHIQTFLLHTSLLDHLSGPLCRAVSGEKDAQAILEQLELTNVFLFPLEDQLGWYRYHGLFAETLRHHLKRTNPEIIPILRMRASQWYEEHDLIEEAIHYSLAIQDVERTAMLIDRIAHTMLGKGEAKILEDWLTELPFHIVCSSPRLCITSAWVQLLTEQSEKFKHWVDTAEQALHASAERFTEETVAALQGEILALRALWIVSCNDYAPAITLCKQALSLVPQDNLYARSLILFIMGMAYQRGESVTSSAQALAEASTSSQAIDHALLVPYVMIGQAESYEIQGHPFRAMKAFENVLKLAPGRNEHAIGLAYIGLGRLFWEWNDTKQAQQYFLLAWKRGQQTNSVGALFNSACLLAQTNQVQGNLNETEHWIQQIETLARKSGDIEMLTIKNALRSSLALAQGNIDEALSWMEKHIQKIELENGTRSEFEYLIEAHLYVAAGRAYNDDSYIHQAVDLLAQLHKAAVSIGKTKSIIEIQIIQALAFSAQGNQAEALSILEHTLSLAEPGKYIRPFVDKGEGISKLVRQIYERSRTQKIGERAINLNYLRQLLTAFTYPLFSTQTLHTGEDPQSLPYPLSWRENEVLRLMAAGWKNQEIANELVVVTGTVKAHIHSIYRKLSVNSRVQAIARARALHLL